MSVIAKTLSLSYKSVYNAVKKHELNFYHSSITDEELDIIVWGILQKWPTTGNIYRLQFYNCFVTENQLFLFTGHKAMLGMYTSFGPRVTRKRLRNSLNRVRDMYDIPPPVTAIRRRVYFAKGPLSMIHIDGYHGLTRYLKNKECI